MISATSINEVITCLDQVIEWSKANQSRIGYFACLYRKMTVAVKDGIKNNQFDDGPRMEMLDVIFANRYLQAWDAYTHKESCTNAWCAAFDATSSHDLIVLQHLTLGINAHINLDLGIAAALACPGDKIYELEADFGKINTLIASLMQNVQDELANVWPPLKLITHLTNHHQDVILNFSITTAREASWANALVLANASDDLKFNYIKGMDRTVCNLAQRIISPGFATRLLLIPIVEMEDKNVNDIIDILA